MSSPRTHTLTALFLALFMVFCAESSGTPSHADDLEGNFENLKTQYTDAWQQAAESTQRSSALEQQLTNVKQRVAEARARVEKAESDKQGIRVQAREIRSLSLALTKQLDLLHQENDVRTDLFREQKELFGEFVRVNALSSDLPVDTGPVIGGTVLRRLLYGSLGDQIQSELRDQALRNARTSILQKLQDEADASVKSEQALNDSAQELADRLESLKTLHAAASDASHAAQDDLQTAVQQRDLTEAEYAAVKQAMDDQLASIRSLQNNISSIQQELKDFHDQQFAGQIAELTETQTALTDTVNDLTTQQNVLNDLIKSVEDAYRRAEAMKNSDKNSYRDLEQAKLDVQNDQIRIDQITAMKEPETQDQTSVAWDIYRKAKSEERSLRADLAWKQQELSYMKIGWPKDVTDAYLKAKTKAGDAHDQLPSLKQKLADTQKELLDVQQQLATLKDERDKNASSQFTFNLLPGSSTFQWPAKGRITAGYLDPTYEAHFRVPHRAIDIAVSQGTPVFAARDGVVYTVKDGGSTGYSYVLIAHDDGYSTIYGHLSKMFVSPGQLIERGHVIGLSGGTPGTPGAGWMTTGPHLHFEVHKDGKSVNPLSVLP